MQDLIASQTYFKPYNIKLLKAWKSENDLRDFNCFNFEYEGLTYELIKGKLKIIQNDTI